MWRVFCSATVFIRAGSRLLSSLPGCCTSMPARPCSTLLAAGERAHLPSRNVFGCSVVGTDLSAANVAEANAEAERRGLSERVRFSTGDAEVLPFAPRTFDALLCECAFCTSRGYASGAVRRQSSAAGCRRTKRDRFARSSSDSGTFPMIMVDGIGGGARHAFRILLRRSVRHRRRRVRTHGPAPWNCNGRCRRACAGRPLGDAIGAQVLQSVFGGIPGKSLLGGVAVGYAAVVYAKRQLGIRRPTGDLFAVALAAGEAVGRVGCFFAGCCYGKVTTVPWAVHNHGAWRQSHTVVFGARGGGGDAGSAAARRTPPRVARKRLVLLARRALVRGAVCDRLRA
jgi:hypothetical protein